MLLVNPNQLGVHLGAGLSSPIISIPRVPLNFFPLKSVALQRPSGINFTTPTEIMIRSGVMETFASRSQLREFTIEIKEWNH